MLGFAGIIYGATAFISGAIFVVLAVQLSRSRGVDRRAAHRLFVFSISYLFVLFAALLVDHSASMLSSRGAPTGGGYSQSELLPHPVRIAFDSTCVTAHEV
jgi:protoheme IX farnesyltransferase